LRKIRLPPNLSERKYCVSRRGSISEYAWRQTTAKKAWTEMSWILKVNRNSITCLVWHRMKAEV
jgi:hypothetical protein